ncbi:hypothetical protein GCM10010169_47660 [Micromonospora fulviviridis]|nr:hypothetical protein GCM10010169_47660 [Micromonospora fulviviridis]
MLDEETTIFVGANNSGKTSATHVFPLFLGNQKGQFQLYDFSADCWNQFSEFNPERDDPETSLPRIVLDLWFVVDDENLHRVVDFIPTLEWNSEQPVGVRLEYMPRDHLSLITNFHEALDAIDIEALKPESHYKPWPEDLTDYLTRRLRSEYGIRYSVLDSQQCDDDGNPNESYTPYVLGSSDSGSAKKLESLIRVDFLSAQRHLTDTDSRGRAEELSKRLSRFYSRNLEKRNEDLEALNAISESEEKLNAHFAKVFGSTLEKLTQLGYPGLTNPSLVIKASFNPESILNTSARVHYALPQTSTGDVSQTTTLPDHYNGLGFKNLIYMVVEVLDFHHAWTEVAEETPPIHLIMIEEPEAHLHAQLQQVFIRKIRDILPPMPLHFTTQMIVTTHSAHVIYESNFEPIRYFKRSGPDGNILHSDVRNLSTFHNNEEQETREFIRRYLKLTHCDLFFADAAVLVEGNVERLLVPLIIHKATPALRQCHLTILELGGAFAHKFRSLLEFLGLTTLVITDLDSVYGEDNEASGQKAGSACMTTTAKARTSNETLRAWLPSVDGIAELLELSDKEKCPPGAEGQAGKVRIAFQTKQPVTWNGESLELAGRTFEEAFALQNLRWSQDSAQQGLGLGISGSESLAANELHEKLHKRVKSFEKTSFAMGLIAKDPESWAAPHYIVNGLSWLADELLGPETSATDVEEG